ncbi:MAG: hypothetical protein ACXWHF_03020 [Chthoniobacterales bacterium]
MSAIVDALIAREAKLEEIVAAVVDENAKLHAELNEALVNGDLSAVQGVVDRLGVVNDKLSSIVPAPAPTLVVEVPVTEAPAEAPAAEAPVDPAA